MLRVKTDQINHNSPSKASPKSSKVYSKPQGSKTVPSDSATAIVVLWETDSWCPLLHLPTILPQIWLLNAGCYANLEAKNDWETCLRSHPWQLYYYISYFSIPTRIAYPKKFIEDSKEVQNVLNNGYTAGSLQSSLVPTLKWIFCYV